MSIHISIRHLCRVLVNTVLGFMIKLCWSQVSRHNLVICLYVSISRVYKRCYTTCIGAVAMSGSILTNFNIITILS